MAEHNCMEQADKIIVTVDPDLADLVPGFLDNRRKEIEALHDALDMADYDHIQRLGHRMKGVGGGYGFDGISDLGRAIEAAAIEKNDVNIRKEIEALSSYLDRLEVRYA